MALSQSSLASGLTSLVPTVVEATAAAALANAWNTYFSVASVTGIPIAPAILASATSAFQSALTGMSVPGAGAAKIQAAVTAFWGSIVGAAAAAWIIAPSVVTLVTPPTTTSGIAAALAPVFAASSADPTKTIVQAASDIAAVLHTNGGVGGIATVQPPPIAPPVPTPIL
jgi:hypothetical protein